MGGFCFKLYIIFQREGFSLTGILFAWVSIFFGRCNFQPSYALGGGVKVLGRYRFVYNNGMIPLLLGCVFLLELCGAWVVICGFWAYGSMVSFRRG